MPSKTAAPAQPSTATSDQPSAMPTRKLAFAGGLGVPLTTIIVTILREGFGIDLPDQVVGIIGSVITFGIGYVVKDRA